MKGELVRLSIVRSDQQCVFFLTYQGEPLAPAKVVYPDQVMRCYDEWRSAYLTFYRDQRGRKEAGGVVMVAPLNWTAILETAKVNLLEAFENWLKDGALFNIRECLTRLAGQASRNSKVATTMPTVDVFLSCDSIELARLPWEAWSLLTANRLKTTIVTQSHTTIATKSDQTQIRLFRTQSTNVASLVARSPSHQRRQPRILVIIGEDGQLNFKVDLAAIQKKLARKVDLHCVNWHPNKDLIQFKKEIVTAIADKQGWDILYFAGHSNETTLTGGELAIAPNTTLQVSEIAPDIKIAIQHGLRFAFFNSCSGISIADTLIELGLNQVAVMREPIANALAQRLLVLFLEELSNHQDVASALANACDYLRTSEERFEYPSAYLVPSLYCAPDATLFRLPEKTWQGWFQRWRPTYWEAIVVSSIAFVSLFYPVQDWLIARRLLMQAIYRDIITEPSREQPAILLIQIDQNSIEKAKISKDPIDRIYLAQLIEKISDFAPKAVGIDFSLFDAIPQNSILSKTVKNIAQKKGIWFVFGVHADASNQELLTISKIANPKWSLQGSITGKDGFVDLPKSSNCFELCPFSYWLALASTMKSNTKIISLSSPLPVEKLSDLKGQLLTQRDQESIENKSIKFYKNSQISELSRFSNAVFGNLPISYIDQMWLHPIIDFSISPEPIYRTISAWQFLEADIQSLSAFKSKIIIIAPNFPEAGIVPGEDNFTAPDAFVYWWKKNTGKVYPDNRKMTGGEAHAYMTYHYLKQHLVVPIPDLWIIGITAILGKIVVTFIDHQTCLRTKKTTLHWVIFVVVFYGGIGLQVYLAVNVLLPWFLPSLVFLLYLTPSLRRMFYL